MARIRQVKPDFFTDEQLASTGPLGMLLFEGLWVLADREGRLKDIPFWIHGQVFPFFPDVKVDELLSKLEVVFCIKRYQIGENRYIQVENFGKHQHVHKDEKPSIIPPIPLKHKGRKCGKSIAEEPGKGGKQIALLTSTYDLRLTVGSGESSPQTQAAVKRIKETTESKSEFRKLTDQWMISYAQAAKARGWKVETYDFNRGKDGKTLSDLMKKFGVDVVTEVIVAFFALDDDWVANHGGYTVGVFKSQFNKLVQNIGSNGNGSRRQTVFEKFYADFIAQNGSQPVTRQGFLDYCHRNTNDPDILGEIERDIDQLLTAGTRA